VAAYLFTFQLYLDFSGYSDMRWYCQDVGIRLTRNFATPYLSPTPPNLAPLAYHFVHLDS
jgi:D-alanyl-lipoteichoic acid acyltransferase DltB (MBOAT superfamily)